MKPYFAVARTGSYTDRWWPFERTKQTHITKLKSLIMELEYDYWTGTLSEVKESLIRSVGQYTRFYNKVKIGITNNPERRVGEHKRSSATWNKMVVKYKTTSVNYINQLERILIDYHWDYIKNKVGGGGGPDGVGPYYLYVLLK